ncbi:MULTISPECIES: TetR/AcrR family transcriptional regulator [Bacillales]|uniref:TetR/AcrR family transcriptional regulator n=1 Tax=Bacillales TaxID=1385 RepID=UPI0006A76295|nr:MULTISPECIES: TetR/AcrR family transcriptional regulator [Bacillales]OBZ11294.1 TetR family transcriptional regulator [Bacillus sp. FJAT-26390]
MSPRNVEKDRMMREKRVQHILDCALKVMAINGFQLTSIQDIASEANMSVGSVYHYFESKEEIFSEVLRSGQTNYGKYVSEVAAMDIDPVAKLRTIMSSWLSIRTNWAFTILMNTARLSQATPPDIKKAITDRFTANLNPVAAIMRDGMERGVIVKEDPLQLAFYFVSLIQGLTLQRPPDYEVQIEMNVDAMIGLFKVKDTGKSVSKKKIDKA